MHTISRTIESGTGDGTVPPRGDPTLREFLVELVYPIAVQVARWIARKYGLRTIQKP